MKVVIHNDGRELRGSERQLSIIARGLQDRGHRVLVSCLAGGGLESELKRLDVPTTRVRPKGDAHLPAAIRFALLLRRERPDALLCSSWPRLFWATWAGRRAGVPRIVARLGIVRPAERRWKYRKAFERLDGMIVNSETVKESFSSTTEEVASEAIHVVWNATVPEPIEGGEAVRRALGLEADTIMILSMGALTHRKGYDLLIRALQSVSAHLAIAGSGPQETEFRELAREQGVADRTHFLGRRDDIPALLDAADLLVLASRNDSMPNAMLEAMAAGVPALVTETAGVREALGPRDGHPPAGWTVPLDDAGALRDALAEAVSSCRTEDGRGRGREGARRARAWFGPERMVTQVEAVLEGKAPSEASP